MILIYTHKLTPRLKYIFKTIFIDILKKEINFTNNTKEFENSNNAKINYSTSKLNSGIFFESSSLLFENGIKKQNISIFDYKNNPCFFSVSKESEFPFDPFAAIFYLVSRYEEYLPHKEDEHDRFLASESLAFQNSFLEIPLANIWINNLANKIESHFQNLKFEKKEFQFISTIDIDNAYAYKHKGFIRTVGILAKSLLKGTDFSKKIKVIFGNDNDPYNTFDYQFKIHKKYNTSPIYFFLLGDYAANDKNISAKNKTFQTLIKSISDNNRIGIHPSYASNSNIRKITKERNRLQTISQKKVRRSRQHYLKLNLPHTYRNLINNGITEDHTMGYAEQSGFRASICSPYYFYDLEKEEETTLLLFPFTTMEATFQYYLKSTPEEAIKHINKLMQKVKEVNGTFISVWHNESLSDEGIWKGWKIVYEKMLKESFNKN
ncbi:MAG: polysaccharide deacetylase family protein [Flavobacteriales bacterium]|nr:polysaccharide deacetylase family protein [Flavobacteriales bacterium]